MGGVKLGNLESLFLQEKPTRILRLLLKSRDPTYISAISRRASCSFAHTLKLIARFERLGLVSLEPRGRIKLVSLTELGRESAEALEDFAGVLKLSELWRRVETTGTPESRAKRLKALRRGLERGLKLGPRPSALAKKLLGRLSA